MTRETSSSWAEAWPAPPLPGRCAPKASRAPSSSSAAELHHPYLRPPLSKEYLLGKEGEDAIPVVPPGWYAENDVDLRLGVTVTSIGPGDRTVLLERRDVTVLQLTAAGHRGAPRARFRCRAAICRV